MAWDEWEQIKAGVAARQGGEMQLNQVPPEPGGSGDPGGDLRVSQKDLKAVGNSAYELLGRLGQHGRSAWYSSQSAASDLKTQGFALGGGLDSVQEKWETQLRSLLDACGHISNHLDFTQKSHRNDDHHVYNLISSIAELDKGFDDGGRR